MVLKVLFLDCVIVSKLYLLLLLCVRLYVFGNVTAIDVNYSTDEPECVCIPILVTTFPEWLSGTEPLPHTPGAVRQSSLCL